MKLPVLSDIDLHHKTVVIRADFNVPLEQGRITHDVRIQASLPTLRYALEHGAGVVVLSHLGRPEEGQWQEAFSLKPVAQRLSELLGQDVKLVASPHDIQSVAPGQVVMLENVRFFKGEKANDPILAKTFASLGDVFVMDAFSVAHRAQASTVGVASFAPYACAGLFLQQELLAITRALESPEHPFVAIVGGAKVSTKFKVLDKLLDRVDTLIVGGGMANTFLKAQGLEIGSSLYEADWLLEANKLIDKVKGTSKQILLPIDCVVGESLDAQQGKIKSLNALEQEDKIFDLGPKSIDAMTQELKKAKTIVWNGPVGVFENPAFSEGTRQIAQAVAQSKAFSLAGGGDTLAAIEQSDVHEGISYQSSAGGAFLEFLEGAVLPGLEVLYQRNGSSRTQKEV